MCSRVGVGLSKSLLTRSWRNLLTTTNSQSRTLTSVVRSRQCQAVRRLGVTGVAHVRWSGLSHAPVSGVRWFATDGEDQKVKEEDGDGDGGPLVIIDKMESLHIMTIGINREKKRNCVDTPTSEQLKMAFQDFEHDDNMYCCVLHGVGGNFSAGYDLDELAELKDDLPNKIAEILMDSGPMGPTNMELSKPVIAAVNGYCVAGGLELALMCDLRVVEENTKLGFLNRRFGVPLIDGGTVRLPALIGLSRAMDLILTGRMIDAREALASGIANRVVSTGTAFGQAVNLAKELTKFPQECLRADRMSAIHSTFSGKTMENDLAFESENAAHVLTTEAVAGAKKFMSGLGRSGKFNVSQVAEPEEWQKEFNEMKKMDEEKKKAE